jgi:hypothetical protein
VQQGWIKRATMALKKIPDLNQYVQMTTDTDDKRKKARIQRV